MEKPDIAAMERAAHSQLDGRSINSYINPRDILLLVDYVRALEAKHTKEYD